MVRSILVLVLGSCFLFLIVPLRAQAQAEAAQTPVTEPAPVGQPDATKPTPTTVFPFDAFPEFSAMMEGSVMVGDERQTHIYRSNNLLRMESAEGLGYFITDLKTLDTYGLSLTGCMKDHHPYFRSFPLSASRPGRKMESLKGGKETIDGHVCQIEDVTISGGGLFNPMTIRFWEAEDLHGFPVKVQVVKGPHAVMQYTNVVIGPQDKTLFIHPNSCKGSLPQMPAQMPVPAPPKAKNPPVTPQAGTPQN